MVTKTRKFLAVSSGNPPVKLVIVAKDAEEARGLARLWVLDSNQTFVIREGKGGQENTEQPG